MVYSAKATAGTDTGPFDRFRSKAEQAFDTSRMSNLLPTGRPFHPAVATPPDWCAPQNAGGWTSTSFSHTEKTETGVSVGEPAAAPRRAAAAVEHACSIGGDEAGAREPRGRRTCHAAIAHAHAPTGWDRARGAGQHPLRASAAAPRGLAARGAGVGQMTANSQTAVPPHIQALAQESAQVSFEPQAPMRRAAPGPFALGRISPGVRHTVHVASSQRAAIVMRADVLAAQTMTLNAAASVREVTSNSISLSFEYCLVNVTRPWLSTEFLSLKNWYMDGYRDGELASGSGVGGMPLEVMPVAALVVRKLSIKAAWSHEDQTVAAQHAQLRAVLSAGSHRRQNERRDHLPRHADRRLGMRAHAEASSCRRPRSCNARPSASPGASARPMPLFLRRPQERTPPCPR